MTDRRAWRQWVDRCPLRAWRIDREVTVMRAASALGVSMTTIQLWERGVNLPSPERFASIEELVGEGTMSAWADWYNQRPEAA